MKPRLNQNTRLITSFALSVALALSTVACVKRPRERGSSSKSGLQTVSHSPQSSAQTPNQRINLNNASARELEKLPGIGKGLAARIVEHREKYGPFRRAEHLMMVRGFGDRRVRALRDRISVE
jgi:competence ComEA-like helix-hairpin-helix protein